MSKKFEKSSGKASPALTGALNTAVTIVCKVMEVFHWIGAVGILLLAIFGFTGGAFPSSHGDANLNGLNIYGFEMPSVMNGDTINYPALGWFSIGGAIILAIMAMVFRNVYLITKNSQKKTPFTEDNMRMVKELGIFFIAAPVVAIVFGLIIFVVTGGTEVVTDINTVIVGLIMLYLTQIFARGVELEDDVKDLV